MTNIPKEEEDTLTAAMADVNLASSSSCAACDKSGAARRCAKRHAGCADKLYCDKTCDADDHRRKKEEEGKENVGAVEDKMSKVETDAAEKALKAKKKKAKKALAASKKDHGVGGKSHIAYKDYE